jgi:hypothetical protein
LLRNFQNIQYPALPSLRHGSLSLSLWALVRGLGGSFLVF